MIDLTLPKGALSEDATAALVKRLTKILLKSEGAPDNEAANSIAWAFVNWVDAVHVGGSLADLPRYRVITTVPQGGLTDKAKSSLVAEVTEAVLEAEGSKADRVEAMRVWCIINEVTDGNWGGAGRIFRLKDIATFVLGDAVTGEAFAAKRLARA
jgi:phenylpyruvate tautomerase PptA (4-oxalocrotonate tautomerase family)